MEGQGCARCEGALNGDIVGVDTRLGGYITIVRRERYGWIDDVGVCVEGKEFAEDVEDGVKGVGDRNGEERCALLELVYQSLALVS